MLNENIEQQFPLNRLEKRTNLENLSNWLTSLSIIELDSLLEEMMKTLGKERLNIFINILNQLWKNKRFNFYSVFLTNVGPNKIHCIKLIRNYKNMNLKDAKNFVESVLYDSNIECIITDVTEPMAKKIKLEFLNIGSTVEIQKND